MLPPPGYRDIELCGSGATSRVYRAVSARGGRIVALKRLHRQLVRDADALGRLRREFEALSRLRHPTIVGVRDVIRWQGDPTVVMDFIEGQDLKARIDQEGPLSATETERIANALLEALSVAHGAGIVHRDLKPQNIRLGVDGQVYLLDFGSARLDAASQLTATGSTVGTPDYMAPELFAGSVYDPRVDLYGLGATLFECLTGRPPQVARTLTELAYQRTKTDAPAIRSVRDDVPAPLAQLIDRCLARSPDDRYASVSLARWALDHPSESRLFDARRARFPPCLHCGTGVSPQSTVCPRCLSERPFAFVAGSSAVVLKNVRDPARFIQWMGRRFPERTAPGHVRELAERCASLEYTEQTLVSFISRVGAKRIAADLADIGVQADVVDDEGTTGWRQYAYLLSAFMGLLVFAGITLGANFSWYHPFLLVAPAAMALLADRVASVARAQQGILADSRYPAAIVPSIRGPLFATAAAFAGLATVPALAAYPGTLFIGAMSAFMAGLVAVDARFERAAAGMTGSPEPSLMVKLRQAFSVAASADRRIKAGVAIVLTGAVVSTVPLEIYLMQSVGAAVTSASIVAPAAVALPAASATIPAAPEVLIPGAPTATPAPLLAPEVEIPHLSSGAAHLPPPTVRPTHARDVFGAAMVSLAGLLLSAFIARRRRKIRAEADHIRDSMFDALGEPLDAPVARVPAHAAGAADRIARSPAIGAFAQAARERASELAHNLPSGEAERLRWAIELLPDHPLSSADASLLARSIQESDPDQKLRFELLALEGRLEAIAAKRWAAALSGSQEDPA